MQNKHHYGEYMFEYNKVNGSFEESWSGNTEANINRPNNNYTRIKLIETKP